MLNYHRQDFLLCWRTGRENRNGAWYYRSGPLCAVRIVKKKKLVPFFKPHTSVFIVTDVLSIVAQASNAMTLTTDPAAQDRLESSGAKSNRITEKL